MRRFAWLLAAAALGCGGGNSPASATLNGNVQGKPMKPADAISSPAHVSLAAISAEVVAIVLTDAGGVCAKVSANTEPKNGRALIILLADFANFVVTAPSGTGTFNVYDPSGGGLPPAHLAVATFGVNDAACNEVPAQSAIATSGAVRITSASGGAYGGTYTIGFETGEQVSGEFHTANCPGLSTFLGNGTHSCG